MPVCDRSRNVNGVHQLHAGSRTLSSSSNVSYPRYFACNFGHISPPIIMCQNTSVLATLKNKKRIFSFSDTWTCFTRINNTSTRAAFLIPFGPSYLHYQTQNDNTERNWWQPPFLTNQNNLRTKNEYWKATANRAWKYFPWERQHLFWLSLLELARQKDRWMGPPVLWTGRMFRTL